MHDHTKSFEIVQLINSSVVAGPVKGQCDVRICNDSKLVIFCDELLVRDCTNLEIMLCSPVPPIIESCTGIKFVPMSYTYPELLSQMHTAGLSPWLNSWNDAIVKTMRASISGENNWAVSPEIQWNFVPPLEWAEEAFSKCKAFQGVGKVTGLHHITREDLASIEIKYNEEAANRADLFNLGTYFNQYGA